MVTVKLLKIKVLIRTHKFINNYKTPAYHHTTSHKHKTRQKIPQSTKLTNLPNFPVIQFHCHFNTKKRMSIVHAAVANTTNTSILVCIDGLWL